MEVRVPPETRSAAARITVESVGSTPVIGPKKLATIRREFQLALTATGEDSSRWLESRIALPR